MLRLIYLSLHWARWSFCWFCHALALKLKNYVYVSVRSPLEKTRYDTSLGLLTKKFVGLIKNAPDGVGAIFF